MKKVIILPEQGMTRVRLTTVQRQVRHLKNEIERYSAQLHFAGLQPAAQLVFAAVKPLELALVQLQDDFANEEFND